MERDRGDHLERNRPIGETENKRQRGRDRGEEIDVKRQRGET